MATIIDTLVTRFTFVTDKAALGALETRVNAMRARLSTLSTQSLIFGAAAAGGLAAITKTGIDTDRAMNKLRTTLGLTREEAEAFRQQALDVGSKLPVNTDELIEAQTVIAQFGKNAEETLAFTPFVIETAVAAGLKDQLADVAKWALQAEANLELNNDELAKFLGQMVHVGKIAPGSFAEVGAAFGASIKTVKDAGIANEDYLSILANLKTAGLEIPAASQGLNLLLTNLNRAQSGVGRGGKMVTELLEVAKIDTEELKEIMTQEHGFLRLLDQIDKRSPDKAALSSIFAQLGGTTYGSAFAGLAGMAQEAVRDAQELRGIGAEAVAKDIKELMSGVSGAFDLFVAAIDTFRNAMFAITNEGDAIERFITKVTEGINGLLAVYEEGANAGDFVHRNLLDLIAAGLKWGTALIGVSFALKALSFLLGGLIPLIRLASFAMAGFTAFMNLLVPATRAATLAQIKLNIAMLANPIGLIIVGIVALIAAIAATVYWWDEIVAAMQRAWDWMVNLWNMAEQGEFGWFVQAMVRLAIVAFEGLIAVFGLVADAWGWIAQKWSQAASFFSDIGASIAEAWGSLTEWISARWDAFINGFLLTNPEILNAFLMLQEVIPQIWDSITNYIIGKWDSLKETLFNLMPDWMRYVFGIEDRPERTERYQVDKKVEQADEQVETITERRNIQTEQVETLKVDLQTATRAWLSAIEVKESPETIAQLESAMNTARAEFLTAREGLGETTSELSEASRASTQAHQERLAYNLGLDDLGVGAPDALVEFRAGEVGGLLDNRQTELVVNERANPLGDIQLDDSPILNFANQILGGSAGESKETNPIVNAQLDDIPLLEFANGLLATPAPTPNLIGGRSPEAVAAPISNQITNADQNRSVSVGEITVQVDAAGADAQEIAEAIPAAIRDEIHLLVDSSDSNIAL